MAVEWLSIGEVAKQLGLAENTARRYVNLFKEYIHSKQFGRATKYAPESLEILSTVSRLYQEGLGTQEIQERLRGTYTLHLDIPQEEELHAPVAIAEIREAMMQMADYIKRQDELNLSLAKQIEEHRIYIEQSVKERDEKLMAAIRELTEAKQEAAASKWWKWWK